MNASPVFEHETEEELAKADAAAVLDDDIPAQETFTREIPGAAGHGPARAYGYIALAQAFGAKAELTSGGTRNTGRVPLEVTVATDADTFARINDLYDEVVPAAEEAARDMRSKARQENTVTGSYDVSLLTRGVLAGFPQGVASAMREPGTTKPAPLLAATRAHKADEKAHRRAIISGRQWAEHRLAAENA